MSDTYTYDDLLKLQREAGRLRALAVRDAVLALAAALRRLVSRRVAGSHPA